MLHQHQEAECGTSIFQSLDHIGQRRGQIDQESGQPIGWGTGCEVRNIGQQPADDDAGLIGQQRAPGFPVQSGWRVDQ